MRECINRTKTEAGFIWEVLKRRKLRTFKNQAKTMKVKIQEKVITLREECGLVTLYSIPRDLFYFTFRIPKSGSFQIPGF